MPTQGDDRVENPRRARAGDIAGVACELAGGIAVDCLEIGTGQSALQCVVALQDASLAMIQFLVRMGAKVSPAVFRAAVQTGSLNTITFLLQSGAVPGYQDEGGCGTLTYTAYDAVPQGLESDPRTATAHSDSNDP